MGVMGLSVCAECGSVRSFMGELRESGAAKRDTAIVLKDMTGLRPRQLLRVPDPGRALQLTPISNEVARAMQQAKRVHRCRVGITRVSLAIQVQVSVIEPALNLMMRHCKRVSSTGAVPAQPKRLKCLSCACILIASSRQGLGVTIQEVAAKADQPLGNLQKKVWQVCMANGVRLLRNAANTTALLNRICDGFNLTVEHQRGAICAAASRLMLLAEWGWVATGRHWVYIVGAAFMMAAKAYHVAINLDALGVVLCIPTGTILKRMAEIQRIVISLLRDLPWGHMVNAANIHAYMHFALEFFEVLAPASVELRKERLRLQDEAQVAADASRPPRAAGSPVPPLSSGNVQRKRSRSRTVPRAKSQHKRSAGIGEQPVLVNAPANSRSAESCKPPQASVSATPSHVEGKALQPLSEIRIEASSVASLKGKPHAPKLGLQARADAELATAELGVKGLGKGKADTPLPGAKANTLKSEAKIAYVTSPGPRQLGRRRHRRAASSSDEESQVRRELKAASDEKT